MLILYENDRYFRSVLFTKTSNEDKSYKRLKVLKCENSYEILIHSMQKSNSIWKFRKYFMKDQSQQPTETTCNKIIEHKFIMIW